MRTSFEDYKAAIGDYKKDFNELKGMGERVMGWLGELRAGKRKPDASACKAELKTIAAQLEKIEESMIDAQKRFHDRVDAIDAKVVEKFQGLCAYAVGTGTASAGTRLLYDTCLDFSKAKGESRREHFSTVCSVVNALADSLDKRDDKTRIDPAKVAIYDQFNSMPDGTEKGAFYSQNKAVILAVEDLKKGTSAGSFGSWAKKGLT
jgi:hypothetical protein